MATERFEFMARQMKTFASSKKKSFVEAPTHKHLANVMQDHQTLGDNDVHYAVNRSSTLYSDAPREVYQSSAMAHRYLAGVHKKAGMHKEAAYHEREAKSAARIAKQSNPHHVEDDEEAFENWSG